MIFFFRNYLKSLSDTSIKECNDSGDDGDYSNKLNPINSPGGIKLCNVYSKMYLRSNFDLFVYIFVSLWLVPKS